MPSNPRTRITKTQRAPLPVRVPSITSPGTVQGLEERAYKKRQLQEGIVVQTIRDEYGGWTGWVEVFLPALGTGAQVRALAPAQIGTASKIIDPPTKGTGCLVQGKGDYYVITEYYPLAEAKHTWKAQRTRHNPKILDGEHVRTVGYATDEDDTSAGYTKSCSEYMRRTGTLERVNHREDIYERLGGAPVGSSEQLKYLGEDVLLLLRLKNRLQVMVNALGDLRFRAAHTEISATDVALSVGEALSVFAESLSLTINSLLSLHVQSADLKISQTADVSVGKDLSVETGKTILIKSPDVSIEGDATNIGTGAKHPCINQDHKYRTFCPVIGAPVGTDGASGFPKGSATVQVDD